VTSDVTEEMRLTQAMLDAAPDAIGLFDEAGRVIVENTAMARLRPGFEAAGWQPPFEDRRESRRDVPSWNRLELAGDRKRHFRRYSAAIPGSGQLVVLHDATAEYEAEQAKDSLFRLVSHELQTPLTSVIGYIDLARSEDSAPERERFLATAARNASRLQQLVNDLLFLSRAEVGEIGVVRDSVDLAEIARESAEAAGPSALQRRVSLVLEAETARVEGDRRRLLQAVDNLVSNAIKFTPTDGDVSVRVRPEGEDAILEVSDTGPGVPSQERQRIFEGFYRSPRTANDVHGVGLGLTVARAIIELHDGDIAVEGRDGPGTTFRVCLPAGAPSGGAIG
jgi:signal transduction histidine kinase